MRIDLHTHSTCSDGTLSPADLVLAARDAGVDVLGLTDHDTTAGWDLAAQALPPGMSLVRGAEFSTRDRVGERTMGVHLLGYLFDPLDPSIVAEQARIFGERRGRGLTMVARMAADGIPITDEQVLQIAGSAPIGRPHLGRALVEAGVVDSVQAAFDGPLADRGPYYVHKSDTDLGSAIAAIVAAGGAPVIAHPRRNGRGLPADRIAQLASVGLVGLEIDHYEHSDADRAQLRGIAGELGLVVTGSSDFHGTNKPNTLGAHLTAPEALERLVAATSGQIPVLIR